MMATLAQAQAWLPGSRLVGGADAAKISFSRVHSDSRSLQPGDLFVALRGERFDAHDFLPQARAAGAVAALAERGLQAAAGVEGAGVGVGFDAGGAGAGAGADASASASASADAVTAAGSATNSPHAPLPGLWVPDSLQALQQLAAAWRRRYSGPLVAVTGSNGKTTVTQMVASIFRAWLGDAGLATAGNFNNHIGVPLTLLRLRPESSPAGPAHRAAVLELGMNHPGEIALLAALAQPTVALVNNAQREHQEFMSGVEAVARENGQVIGALGVNGVAVMPAADAYTPLWRQMAGSRQVMSFSIDADTPADVHCTAHWPADGSHWALRLHTPLGPIDTRLALAGRHNLANALAAAACALAAGAPLAAVAQGLAQFEPVAGHSQSLQLQRGGRQLTLIDDSYNANPDSVLAAVDVLASLPGPRWLVLGDMGEVGAQGPQFHAEVGEHARLAGIEQVWAVGSLCRHAAASRHFDSVAELLAALPQAPMASSVLVKGSRFMKMEQVVQALRRSDAAAGSAAGQETANAA